MDLVHVQVNTERHSLKKRGICTWRKSFNINQFHWSKEIKLQYHLRLNTFFTSSLAHTKILDARQVAKIHEKLKYMGVL